MEQKGNKYKNRVHVNSKPIISVLVGLGFLSVILISTMMAAAKNTNNRSTGNIVKQTNKLKVTQAVSNDDRMLAVVENIDTDNKQITLFDVNQQEAIVLAYTGGTNITDKYGQIISISQIDLGIMVDAAYEQDKNRLTGMNISTRAWEYPGVNNISINLTDKILKIASTKYKYTNDIFVLDGKDVVPVDNLAEQDELTVWGYEEIIWSVTVTKGHGTVMLRDYQDYIGDSISIGYESMQQITEDLAVAVREGTFNLTVENGRYSATKSVTVERNKVTYVSLADLGPNGLKLGEVTFEISPEGADLYIDGKLTAYTDPIELYYGEHAVIATLGGYTTYEGTINVDSKNKVIRIELPEAAKEEEAVATESDTASGTDTTNTDSNDEEDLTNNSESDTEYTAEEPEYTLNDGDSVDKEHKIYIKTPSDASVYLDGEYMGTTACSFDKIIGSHVLTFIKDGYETTSYTVEVSDDNLDAYFAFPDLVESE